MYIYDNEDNEPMNEQAYEYLRDKSRKGGEADAMREPAMPLPELVRSEKPGRE